MRDEPVRELEDERILIGLPGNDPDMRTTTIVASEHSLTASTTNFVA